MILIKYGEDNIAEMRDAKNIPNRNDKIILAKETPHGTLFSVIAIIWVQNMITLDFDVHVYVEKLT